MIPVMLNRTYSFIITLGVHETASIRMFRLFMPPFTRFPGLEARLTAPAPTRTAPPPTRLAPEPALLATVFAPEPALPNAVLAPLLALVETALTPAPALRLADFNVPPNFDVDPPLFWSSCGVLSPGDCCLLNQSHSGHSTSSVVG